MSEGHTRRLFVAVPLSQGAEAFARRAQGSLRPIEKLRLVGREQLHCTLAFMGRADDEQTAAARSVVSGITTMSGGEAVIDGLLLLPSARKVRVVALRVCDEDGVLKGLFEAVTGGLEEAGVMRREKRPFRPHVTIARTRSPGPVQPMSECGRAIFEVESVCLYESDLCPQGAVHTMLVRKDLKRVHGRQKA